MPKSVQETCHRFSFSQSIEAAVTSFETPRVELFNLTGDPWEQDNLSDEFPALVEQLIADVVAYAEGTIAACNSSCTTNFTAARLACEQGLFEIPFCGM